LNAVGIRCSMTNPAIKHALSVVERARLKSRVHQEHKADQKPCKSVSKNLRVFFVPFVVKNPHSAIINHKCFDFPIETTRYSYIIVMNLKA
jgi:hypothetical protein